MDFLSAIRRDSDRFYAAAQSSDPGLEVPSCPGWNIADLAWHGEIHWFWATDVETRGTDPGAIEEAKPARPDDYGDLVEWGRSQADRLIGLLETTPDDARVWTWALNESDHTVGFVRRHQVQEAAVHRWDMQHAAAPPPEPIDPEVASDSIDEMLAVTLPWEVRPDRPMSGSVHIHCTDAPGEWLVHPDGRVERAHAKGDVAIRGAASDILLGLYKRVPIERLDVVGDPALAREILDRVDTS